MRLKITSRIVSVMLEAHHFFTIFIFISLWWDKSTYPTKAQTCSFHGMTDFRNKVLLQYLIRGFLTKSDEIQNQVQNLMDMRVYHSDLKDLDNSSNCFYSFSWWNIFLLTSHFFWGLQGRSANTRKWQWMCIAKKAILVFTWVYYSFLLYLQSSPFGQPPTPFSHLVEFLEKKDQSRTHKLSPLLVYICLLL